MSEPRFFHIVTLGCKVNQYESQALREAWIARGWTETEAADQASWILINSCAVTARAVRDVRQTLFRLRRENPRARICLTGCAARLLEGTPSVDEHIDCVHQADKPGLLSPPAAWQVPADRVRGSGFPPFALSDSARARGLVKVQDGCTHRCTYCIVPLTRGPARSRAPAEVLAEVRRLLASGLREIVLVGINLAQYGPDLADSPDVRCFWDLLRHLDQALAPEWAGQARIRLSSLDPAQLTPQALEFWSSARMLCPHLHFSLQSASPSVLAAMHRGHYQPERLLDFFQSFSAVHPIAGLGTDILVGFPGETEACFEETMAFCRHLPLSYAHVFPYSRRPGTPASALPDQVPSADKKARSARLRALVRDNRQAFLARLAALPQLTIAVQETSPGRGVCEYYAQCRFTDNLGSEHRRRLVAARPVAVLDGELHVTASPPTEPGV